MSPSFPKMATLTVPTRRYIVRIQLTSFGFIANSLCIVGRAGVSMASVYMTRSGRMTTTSIALLA